MKTLEELIQLYESHAHCKIWQPKYFAGKLTPLLMSKGFVWLLDHAIPFFDKDILSRLAHFAKMFKKTESEVFYDMFAEYPDHIICVKIMDLSCMGAGSVQKDIYTQTTQILDLGFKNIRLFPVIDPRSKQRDAMLKLMWDNPKSFAGFGIYPNIGYTADDYRLREFWEWAEANSKSVMIHTTDTSPVYYRGKDLETLLQPIKHYFFFNDVKCKKLRCGNFCHPYFGIEQAKKYTNVNVSFCHAGGSNKEFWSYINNSSKSFKNVYFDTSSTIKTKEEFFALVDATKNTDKILVGYDWFMSTLELEDEMRSIFVPYMTNTANFLRE